MTVSFGLLIATSPNGSSTSGSTPSFFNQPNIGDRAHQDIDEHRPVVMPGLVERRFQPGAIAHLPGFEPEALGDARGIRGADIDRLQPCCGRACAAAPCRWSCRCALSVPHAIKAIKISARFPHTHGAPVHFGDPAAIGVDIAARIGEDRPA